MSSDFDFEATIADLRRKAAEYTRNADEYEGTVMALKVVERDRKALDAKVSEMKKAVQELAVEEKRLQTEQDELHERLQHIVAQSNGTPQIRHSLEEQPSPRRPVPTIKATILRLPPPKRGSINLSDTAPSDQTLAQISSGSGRAEQSTQDVTHGPVKRQKTNSVLDAPSIHSHFPTVVKIGGKWVEVACMICGANFVPQGTPRFMNGLRGIARHIGSSHPRCKLKGLEQFRQRVVSAEDAASMLRGEPGAVEIVPVARDF